MASMPCDRHHEPRPGRLVGAYPSIVKDGRRYAKYRRLCTECARDLLVEHATDWVDTAVSGPLSDTTSCTACGLVLPSNGELSRFFCTVYVDGKNRRDYSAAYCPDCTKARVKEFDLDV